MPHKRFGFRGFLFLAPCLVASLRAQATPASSPTASSFPNESYVIKTESTVVTMNADGTGTRVLTFAVVLQSEAAVRQSSVVTAAFARHAEHLDFDYVRVVHPDGTIEATPVSSAIEQPAPVTQQAPLYSDIETKQIPVRSLRTGDTLEWQARVTIDHPDAPNQSWGQDTFTAGGIVLDETYELRMPSAVHLSLWTNPAARAEFSQSDSAGTRVYRWHHTALRPTVGPEADAFTKAEETRLRTAEEELTDTKGALPSFAWSTFSDWAAVGAWYRALTADRVAPDDAIRAQVAQITAGKSTDLEKAQAVYLYVSTQIRYIGVDFGVGRYQPHTAAEVFANRYGDCKDKHTLLAAMLSVLNLHADPVLIGAGIRFNPAVPSPSAFNHLISRLSLDGKDTWLDATAEIGIWGALLKPLRDQDALVIPASGAGVIARTPADLPYAQTTSLAVTGSLNADLTSESKFVWTFRDDSELYLRAALHSIPPANYGAFAQNFMGAMGFGGTTSDPVLENLTDPSQPLRIVFHYHRVKDKDWGENRITATFQGISLPAFAPEKPPVEAIQLGSPRTETSTIEMQLPDGWSVSMPETVHAHTPFATCAVTYRVKDKTLFAERRLVILQSKVPVKDYKQYQTWYDDAGASGYPYIQLMPPPKSVSAATIVAPTFLGASASAATLPSDPHAAELVQKGFDSARAMDLDAARAALDDAAKINPTEARLWIGYSTIAQLLGKSSEVIDDIKRELKYHPEEVALYFELAREQFKMSDADGALVTLRAWVKAAPDSPDAVLMLSRRLQAMRKYAEAIQIVQDAIARLDTPEPGKPEKPVFLSLRIVSASAQIALSRAPEAAAALSPYLDSASEASQKNEIAYILAEASSHLAQAAEAESKILSDDASETAAWTISQDPRAARTQQVNMAARWDTMAWILYRQAKYREALIYTEASRRTVDNRARTAHAEAIAAALHSPAAAALVREDDQKRRTFSLGPAGGRNGVASFTLLIGGGKVIASAPEASHSLSTPTLADGGDLLKHADLHALTPPGSTARLLRNGFVNCHSGTCELVLSPLGSTPNPD